MKNLPQSIWLNIGDGVPDDADFRDLSEVTWCEEQVSDGDIEYHLAPIWKSTKEEIPDGNRKALYILRDGRIDIGYFVNDDYQRYWMPIPEPTSITDINIEKI